MQHVHTVHVDIALHKTEKSDYIQTIERQVLSVTHTSGLGKPLPGNPDENARSIE